MTGDAEHLRAKARELYDFAKWSRSADDGLLCVLEAIELERDADELEQAGAGQSQRSECGQLQPDLAAAIRRGCRGTDEHPAMS